MRLWLNTAMIVHGLRALVFVFCLALLVAPGVLSAHGGVVEEDDVCLIRVEFLSAHFKIYQPASDGHRQFCEDLPAAGESIFVMEYGHDALSEMPIDFRIIRDVTGKGRFARLEDVEQIDDLDAVTVYYEPPRVTPFVYTVLHAFVDEGDYIGMVTAENPASGKRYTAVFPFEVGFTGLGYWPLIVLLLLAVQLQYLYMTGRLGRWFGRGRAAAVLLVLLSPPLLADPVVSFEPEDGAVTINRLHAWILTVTDEQGAPIEGANIEVDGGMPAHDHGLPTRPRVTAELGGGRYRLDGLRFHMRGEWEMTLTITTGRATHVVVLPLVL